VRLALRCLGHDPPDAIENSPSERGAAGNLQQVPRQLNEQHVSAIKRVSLRGQRGGGTKAQATAQDMRPMRTLESHFAVTNRVVASNFVDKTVRHRILHGTVKMIAEDLSPIAEIIWCR
jgi:hypothetical protein